MFLPLVKISLIFTFNFGTLVKCHLKDLGEVTVNVSEVEKYLGLDLESRISGGRPVELAKFPFHAQFLNAGGLCAAIIITIKVLLTAAHCFNKNKNIANMKIFAASRFLFDNKRQELDIWDFATHPHYNEAVPFSNDIAAIVVHGALVFGPLAQPAVLSNSQRWMRETNRSEFMASGWGETSHDGELSKKGLLETDLRYISLETCKKMFEGLDFSPEIFCLYGDGARDTCKGDSGGGIVWRSVVVGIVSHGPACKEAPGMYVNVFYYKGWIQEQAALLVGRFHAFHNFGQNKTDLRANMSSHDAIVRFRQF